MRRIIILAALALAAVLALVACDDGPPSATRIEAAKQEQLTKQGVQQVGMPAIINFQEKRVLKQILELRDTKIVTITYVMDWQAHLHKLCDSIGYGIPYSTQFTNPQQVVHSQYKEGLTSIPQADPNGLYSPAMAEGTWVLCLNPATKDVAPIYVEPRIVVSPFALAAQ
jgi:hypothetical protein